MSFPSHCGARSRVCALLLSRSFRKRVEEFFAIVTYEAGSWTLSQLAPPSGSSGDVSVSAVTCDPVGSCFVLASYREIVNTCG